MSTQARQRRFAHLPAVTPGLNILPPAQRDLWSLLGDIPEDFVLYGGTALALRLGHRQSVDFDFFSASAFHPGELLAGLSWLGRVEILDSHENTLTILTPSEVRVSFFGGLDIQCVAEPSMALDNGVVVASVFDLAGTRAKALLDRAEWRDYVDIDGLLQAGQDLADIMGYATTVFAPSFIFPAGLFLKCLVSFEDGTAPDVPGEVRARLEGAAQAAWRVGVPIIDPFSSTIAP